MDQTKNDEMLLFIYDIMIRARALGYKKEGMLEKFKCLFSSEKRDSARQISDLLDIIHNIPKLLAENKEIDKGYIRLIFQEYESKWGNIDKTTAEILRKYGI